MKNRIINPLIAIVLSACPASLVYSEDAFQWPQDAISGRFTWPVLFGGLDDMLLKGFEPSRKPQTALSRLFAVEDYVKTDFGFEPAQDPVFPDGVDSSSVIWQGEREAVIFVKAKPPTKASPSVVGVIFVATKVRQAGRDLWTVADAQSIVARGAKADITCKLASKKSGVEPAGQIDTVITVEKTIGNKDGFSTTCWSYAVHQKSLLKLQ